MGSEFFWGDKKYVSSKRAAEISGYAPDYIGQLCRKRKLECRLIGRGWFVTEASLLEHKNATKTRPAFQTEKTQKILIKKIEPATPEKSPLISQVPDSWDAFLFREEYQIQKKELQDAYESNYSTENFGAIYPDTFSQKNKEERGVYFKNINERNKILSPFLNFSYSLFVKTLVPMTLVIATGIGVFYVKDIASPLLANLLDSQKIVFKNNIRSFSLNESGNFSSHFENTVQKMQSYFDKKIIYINQAAGGINDNYPLTQNEIPSEDKYKQNIKNVGMLIAAVNFTELFSTELLMNTTQNVKRGYICILEYVSGNTHCFIKTEKVIANKGFSTSILSNFSLQLYHLTNNLMQPIRQEFFTSLVTKLGSRVYQTTNNVTKAVKENTFKLFTAQSPMQTETPNLKEAALRLKQKKEGEISANIISDIATSTTKEQSVVFNPVNENTLIAREGVKNLEQKGFAVESTTGAQTIVERVIERVVAGISPEDIAAQLNALENKLRQEIFKVGESGTREVRVVERQVALTNKIDQLPDVTLINATVSGNFTGLTDAHIPNDIVATNYLELAGGNITGTLGVGTTTPTEDFAVANRIYVGGTGTSTIENNLQVGGALSVSGVCLNCAGNNVLGNAALSVSGTSTFSGQLLSTNVSTVPHSFGTWAIGAAGSNPLTASFVVDPASADSDTNLFAISIGGSARFLVDAEGDVFANSITAVGGVTLSTTSASTFTVEGDTTLGDASTTDRTYFNSRIGSSLIPTADNILDIGDTTNSLAWRTGIFGTSLGVGTTSPAWTLSVAGTGSFDDYVRASYFIATSTVATSTFSGFLDVTGTNSTSTFSGGLTADAFAVTGTASSTFTGGLIVTSGNLSLATNGTFFISDTLALSANTLGSSVVNSSLTSVGTLSSLSVSGAATFSDTLSVSGLASFINASTSRLSVFDTAYFGGTATSTFDSTGALVLNALGSFNSGFISSATSSFVTLQGSDIFASSTLVVDGLSVLGGDIVPDITDGSSLGTTALNFSDLFLDLGAVINFDSGDVTITHGSNDLSVAGGTLSILGGFISSASSSATSLSATDLFASSTIVADGQALF
ncbi:MAG: hypothetical protein HYT93_05165, partial [Parcubacteria group bacterium]|nr:hypothetical protein [Parcubacteria group bacterium]